MQRLALHHVVIFAPDLAAARAFYADVLGLELKHASARHLQLEDAERAGSAIVPSVPSLDAALAELRAKGVRVLHATPDEGPAGRYAAVSDPFGTVFELLEARSE